jgi:hypothetical protein
VRPCTHAPLLPIFGPDRQKLVDVHHRREEIPTDLGDEDVREVFG